MTLLAFHNDPKIKAKYLRRVKRHRKLDQIIHGTYWQNGKGCAVGCTIHRCKHIAYETELGIPQSLAYLKDRIFEISFNGYDKDWAVNFAVNFLEVIPVGVDLSRVTDRFLLWLLVDGIDKYADENGKKAIEGVAGLYERRLNGDEPTNDEWQGVARVARVASYAANAASYAASYAADAARAAYAAYAADAARAASYATDAAYIIKMGDKLLELLSKS